MYRYLIIFSYFIYGCNDIKKPSILNALLFIGLNDSIAVITSDLGGSGRLLRYNENLGLMMPGDLSIHSDAVGKFENQKLFIINRLNRDSVVVINPNESIIPNKEIPLPSGSNPQDIVYVDSLYLYIVFYNTSYISKYDLNSGLFIKNIDISAYAEETSKGLFPDGKPEASSIFYYNGYLYVSLQRLDKNDPVGFFPPSGRSILLKINAKTDTIENSYDFPYSNPVTLPQLVRLSNRPVLIYTCPGRYGYLYQVDGAIVGFDLDQSKFLDLPIAKESNFNADITDSVILSDSLGVASLSDQNFKKTIITFKPFTGERLGTLFEIDSLGKTNFSRMILSKKNNLIIANAEFRNPSLWIYSFQNSELQSPRTVFTKYLPSDLVDLNTGL
jgi:hypothetical protein